MHFDSGGDELPEGEEPTFLDIEPKAGTLVLFKSEKVPHEVNKCYYLIAYFWLNIFSSRFSTQTPKGWLL